LATGVLPLCFGAATKFSQMHLDADKVYRATARLGIKTSTADAEGKVIEERAVQVTDQDLPEVAARYTGVIRQITPRHSALKKDGKALYEYARAGIEIEREAREVTIYALEMTLVKAQDPQEVVQPAIKMVVQCSKGTYIRSLAYDFGKAMQSGSHLTVLRRTKIGDYNVDNALTPENFEKAILNSEATE